MNKFFRVILYWSVLGILFLAALGAIASYLVFKDMPSIESLQNYKPPQSTQVFDRHGHLIGSFFDEKRTVIDINKLPPYVPLAFVAAEDADFYEHKGIDINGLFRAVLLEIKYRLIGGRRVGGSTITQQAARTMLLSSSRSYLRKLKEMVLAVKIEKSLSKEQILSIYLNQIYFGNGSYGIEEASKTYFNKSAKNLELFEAAYLASIPKSPNNINPFGNILRLKERQKYVLHQMLKNEFITEQDQTAALNVPMFSSANQEHFSDQSSQYFLRTVKTQLLPTLGDEFIRRGGIKVFSTLDVSMQRLAERTLRNGLESIDKKFGYRGPIFRPADAEQKKLLMDKLEDFRKKAFVKNKNKIWSLCSITEKDMELSVESSKLLDIKNGVNTCGIITAVNEKLSNITVDLGSSKVLLTEPQLRWALSLKDKNKIASVFRVGDVVMVRAVKNDETIVAHLEQKPQINGGLVTLDVKTGEVLALVGGYDFEDSQYNRITQAKRQVGSTIKPFVYALALDRDLITPASIITDAPKAFLDPITNEFWKPRNHTNMFLGDITVRKCLQSSINICTIAVLEKLGIDKFLNFTKEIGLYTDKTVFPRNLTIALGSAENYPIQIANALRIFPNHGEYSASTMINKVKFFDGTTQKYPRPETKQVLSPQAAFMTTWIIKDVISKQRKEKYLSNVHSDIAGKTGTTNKARTTWFYGFSPDVLTLVYLGYDDNRSIGENAWGINTAFPIWANFMNSLPQNHEEDKFTPPTDIEWRYIDQKDGRAQKSFMYEESENNNNSNIVLESFKPSSAPEIKEDDKDNYNVPLDLLQNSAFAP